MLVVSVTQDGRLKPDDRLMGINGKSLIGCTNNDAMDILRGVLQCNTCRSIELTMLRNRLTPDMFMKDSRFRVPVRNYVSCAQARSEIVSNLSDTISACKKIGCQQVVGSAAESNVSRLIERKDAIPVESFVWLPSVTANSEWGSYENSLAANMSDDDDSDIAVEAKEAATSSEQQASANCHQMDAHLCGSSRAVKNFESGSTS